MPIMETLAVASLIVTGVTWVAGTITGAYQTSYSREEADKQRAFDLDQTRKDYLQEARNYEAAAKEYKLEAEGLESFATDSMRAAADEYSIYTSEMKQHAGTSRASYGASAVEMSGSAEIFQKADRYSMGKDLEAMWESAEQQYEQTMFQRKGSIISYGNAKDQASHYRSQASDLKGEIDDLNDNFYFNDLFERDTWADLAEGIFG